MDKETERLLKRLKATMTYEEYVYVWNMVAQGKMSVRVEDGYVILTKEKYDA